MKSFLLLSCSILLIAIHSQAQNQVFLNIHHKLGANDFAFNSPTKNNLGHDFNLTRLEYYISGITLVHDNGIKTPIDSIWILVNAATPVNVDLGNHPVTQLEEIHFAIGVDSAHNHLDPASFDPSHPLGPKNPSMHWGWVSGYRFLAFEGNGGSNYDQLIQLHGLGDQNFIKSKMMIQAIASNNQLEINLDADYTRVLEDISVNSGIIVHSETLEAQQALENTRYFVFTPSENPTGTRDISPVSQFDVYPNPSINGYTTIWFETGDEQDVDISVTDVLGKEIAFYNDVVPDSPFSLKLDQPGIYFIHLIADGHHLISKQLISN